MNKVNRQRVRFLIVTAALIFSMLTSVHTSYAGEVYTAESRGHYRNPLDGSIEDPGNNAGIGEGMVSNVVYGISLIEKDDNGKLYATLRYRMRDNIRDVKIWVKPKQSSSFVQVPVQETKNEGKSGDFRFEIPSTDCIVKSSFFVVPMSREVIFFVTMENLQPGKGDFKPLVSIESGNSSIEDNVRKNGTEKIEVTPENGVHSMYDKKEGHEDYGKKSVKQYSVKSDSSKKQDSKNRNSKGKIGQEDLGYDHGLLTNKDFKDTDDIKKTNISKPVKSGEKNIEKILISILVITVSVFLGLFFLGAVAVAALYFFMKRRNMEIEGRLSKGSEINSGKKVDVREIICKEDIDNNSNKKDDSLWSRHPGFENEEEKNG